MTQIPPIVIAKKEKGKRKRIPKANEMAGSINQFEIKKGLNPYGFLHIPKAVRPFLPFNVAEPLIARIEGKTLTLTAKEANRKENKTAPAKR